MYIWNIVKIGGNKNHADFSKRKGKWPYIVKNRSNYPEIHIYGEDKKLKTISIIYEFIIINYFISTKFLYPIGSLIWIIFLIINVVFRQVSLFLLKLQPCTINFWIGYVIKVILYACLSFILREKCFQTWNYTCSKVFVIYKVYQFII